MHLGNPKEGKQDNKAQQAGEKVVGLNKQSQQITIFEDFIYFLLFLSPTLSAYGN